MSTSVIILNNDAENITSPNILIDLNFIEPIKNSIQNIDVFSFWLPIYLH